MTMRDILNGGFPSGFDCGEFEEEGPEPTVEEVPEPKDDGPKPVDPRHLATANMTETFCGLPRDDHKVVHPSKARRTDCAVCRKNSREAMTEAIKKAVVKVVDELVDKGIAVKVEPAAEKPAPEPPPPSAEKPERRSEYSRWRPSKAEVAEVLRLRAEGESFNEIETVMGWPIGHGNRPFKICKANGAVKTRD